MTTPSVAGGREVLLRPTFGVCNCRAPVRHSQHPIDRPPARSRAASRSPTRRSPALPLHGPGPRLSRLAGPRIGYARPPAPAKSDHVVVTRVIIGLSLLDRRQFERKEVRSAPDGPLLESRQPASVGGAPQRNRNQRRIGRIRRPLLDDGIIYRTGYMADGINGQCSGRWRDGHPRVRGCTIAGRDRPISGDADRAGKNSEVKRCDGRESGLPCPDDHRLRTSGDLHTRFSRLRLLGQSGGHKQAR
jgi:hypothetical protein